MTIGHDYDLTGIEDWHRDNPAWDISERRGFLADKNDLDEITHIFRIQVMGYDYAAIFESTAWDGGTWHLEFYGSTLGPVTDTGYRSHFFGVSDGFSPTNDELRAFALKVAEEVMEAKPKKKVSRGRVAKAVPMGQLELFA